MIIIEETLKYLGIAFACSVALIVMSKIILQHLIRRPADFYDADELRQEELMLNAGGISITAEHTTGPDGVVTDELIVPWDENEISDTRKAELDAEKGKNSERKLHKRHLNHQVEKEIPIVENPAEQPETASEEPIEEVTEPIEEETLEKVEESIEEPLEEATEVVEKPIEKPQFDKEAIRKQLEQAFDDKIKTVKPTIKLRKSELKAIAEYRGIEFPENATKREILDLINAQENNKEEQ